MLLRLNAAVEFAFFFVDDLASWNCEDLGLLGSMLAEAIAVKPG
jgi:hypothetical protein